jgi:hypothetical protein
MQSYAKSFLTAAVFFVTAGLWAQERFVAHDSEVLARLSYDRSAMPHVDNDQPASANELSNEQLDQLKTLLGSDEFRGLSGIHGGLIREDAESFAAEIPLPLRERADGTRRWVEPEAWRLQWLNADGKSPFPASVTKVVDWLKHFDPKNGKSFDYAEYPDVCPSGQLRLLQPPVAENSQP